MNSESPPSPLIDPELCLAAEGVLQQGETLAGLVEHALRADIEWRRARQLFLTKALSGREQAQRNGDFLPLDAVLAELDDLLLRAPGINR